MKEKTNNSQEILLQYIQSILEEPEKAQLNTDELPQDQLKLARGLQNLAACMQEQKRRLQANAHMDSLTGVGNRMAFDEEVHKLWLHRSPCTVAFIDMDDLKACNDHAGHKEGDHYIQSVSSLLQGICMENEQVFRIGGDEFIILSVWATESDLAQRLQNARKEYVADMRKRVDYNCGFSYGCTHINEATPDAYNNLLATADQKMYEYKLHQKQLRLNAKKASDNNDVFSEKYGLESRIFEAFSRSMRKRYLYVCNMRTNWSRWSKSIVQDFNLPGEYMYDAGNIWIEHIHPDDRAAYLADIGAVFNGKSLYHDIDYRVKDGDGNYVRVSCNGYRLKGTGDEPDLFVGTIQNYGVIETVDPITSLHNIYEFLNQLKHVQKQHLPVDILVIGINNFHLVNDTYGYESGNHLLNNISQQLQELLTENIKLFRLNGMKLAFMLTNSSQEHIHRLYENSLDIFKNRLFLNDDQLRLYIAASAVHYEGSEDDGSSLLSELDYLLEISKQEKSGDLVYVNERSNNHAKHRLEILGSVKRSILNNCEGFYLVYQPQTDFLGRVTGAEALLRWQSVVHGTVLPGDFIPWLENDISFYDLGLWILRQALYDGLGLLKNNPIFSISINISYKQLERESFLNDVLKILKETGFPAENLILEFTEHCRSLDLNRLKYIVDFFNKHKIRIAADDFGTGYSSLMLLRNISFDTIKIDQNFIRGMLTHYRDKILVNTIIDCAHKLDTKVCVEGVENSELMDIARDYNAEFYQGYLIAKPLELKALKLFMVQNKEKF